MTLPAKFVERVLRDLGGTEGAALCAALNAFPGHNLPIGCLGVFILWLGWYGFNGAAATSIEEMGSIFVTTTIAPSVATVVAMIFTWVKYGIFGLFHQQPPSNSRENLLRPSVSVDSRTVAL